MRGTNLPPRWGSSLTHFYPRLTPWAAFLRRFAAGRLTVLFHRVVGILVLPHTLEAHAIAWSVCQRSMFTLQIMYLV